MAVPPTPAQTVSWSIPITHIIICTLITGIYNPVLDINKSRLMYELRLIGILVSFYHVVKELNVNNIRMQQQW